MGLSRRGKIAVGLFGLMVLAGCGGGVWWALRFWDWGSAAAAFPEQWDLAKRRGVPLSAKDLAPNPPVGPEENAAPYLVRMTQALDKIKGTRQRLDEAKTAAEKGDWAVVERILAVYEGALKHAEAAAQKPRVDFGRDWDLGAELQLPELGATGTAARLVSLRALVRAEQGLSQGALEDLERARHLGDLAGQEPTLIATLVQVRTRSDAAWAAERLAARWHQDDRKLAALEATWLRPRGPVDFVAAVRGESFMGFAVIRNILNRVEGPDGETRLDRSRLVREGVPDHEAVRALMSHHLSAWNKAFVEIERHRNDPRRLAAELDAIAYELGQRPSVTGTMASIVFPAFSAAGDAVVAVPTGDAAILELIRALRHRLREGKWPNTVAGIDGFTGTPLRLKATAESIRIYSVGRDNEDDGGRTRAEVLASLPHGQRQGAEGDIVASFPPPKG